MKRSLLVLLIVAFALPAVADQTCKPVEGHFLASLVPPGVDFCPNVPRQLCTAGRVWGGIQGDYQFIATGFLPATMVGGPDTIFFFGGKSTVFLKSGDEMFGTDTGSIDLPPGAGGFASLITFSGGTGEMSASKGQIRLRGEFSAAAGTTSGDYVGTICSQSPTVSQ